jgi:hypothetical protein
MMQLLDLVQSKMTDIKLLFALVCTGYLIYKLIVRTISLFKMRRQSSDSESQFSKLRKRLGFRSKKSGDNVVSPPKEAIEKIAKVERESRMRTYLAAAETVARQEAKSLENLSHHKITMGENYDSGTDISSIISLESNPSFSEVGSETHYQTDEKEELIQSEGKEELVHSSEEEILNLGSVSSVEKESCLVLANREELTLTKGDSLPVVETELPIGELSSVKESSLPVAETEKELQIKELSSVKDSSLPVAETEKELQIKELTLDDEDPLTVVEARQLVLSKLTLPDDGNRIAPVEMESLLYMEPSPTALEDEDTDSSDEEEMPLLSPHVLNISPEKFYDTTVTSSDNKACIVSPIQNTTLSEDSIPSKDSIPSEDSISFKGDISLQRVTPGEDITPLQDITPGEDITPLQDIIPGEDITPLQDITPGEDTTSLQDITPGEDTTSLQEDFTTPDYDLITRTYTVEEIIREKQITLLRIEAGLMGILESTRTKTSTLSSEIERRISDIANISEAKEDSKTPVEDIETFSSGDDNNLPIEDSKTPIGVDKTFSSENNDNLSIEDSEVPIEVDKTFSSGDDNNPSIEDNETPVEVDKTFSSENNDNLSIEDNKTFLSGDNNTSSIEDNKIPSIEDISKTLLARDISRTPSIDEFGRVTPALEGRETLMSVNLFESLNTTIGLEIASYITKNIPLSFLSEYSKAGLLFYIIQEEKVYFLLEEEEKKFQPLIKIREEYKICSQIIADMVIPYIVKDLLTSMKQPSSEDIFMDKSKAMFVMVKVESFRYMTHYGFRLYEDNSEDIAEMYKPVLEQANIKIEMGAQGWLVLE